MYHRGAGAGARRARVRADEPRPLFAAALVLSNAVLNVPAVMLLRAATEPFSGPMLASTAAWIGRRVTAMSF